MFTSWASDYNRQWFMGLMCPNSADKGALRQIQNDIDLNTNQSVLLCKTSLLGVFLIG